MKKLPLGVALLTATLLAACAANDADRPDQSPGDRGPRGESHRGSRPAADFLVERTTTVDQAGIVTARLKRGYLEVGRARFDRKEERNDARAIDQGKTLGADLVVIVDPRAESAVAGGVPTPASSARNPGPGLAKDSASTQASAKTGVEHRGAYAALYFVRHDFSLGALARDLTDQEHRDTGITQGVIVETVVDGSPAGSAGILPGDAVRALDGVPVENLWRFNDMVDRLSGQEATLDLVRQGRNIKKTVKLAD